jgi:hypothetical protein
MSAPQHWAVSVAVDGEHVLTIESNCLSGVGNIDEHEGAIETAARHLLSFIGRSESFIAHAARDAAFTRWWALSTHNGTLPSHRESLAREAYFAAWGGGAKTP